MEYLGRASESITPGSKLMGSVSEGCPDAWSAPPPPPCCPRRETGQVTCPNCPHPLAPCVTTLAAGQPSATFCPSASGPAAASICRGAGWRVRATRVGHLPRFPGLAARYPPASPTLPQGSDGAARYPSRTGAARGR